MYHTYVSYPTVYIKSNCREVKGVPAEGRMVSRQIFNYTAGQFLNKREARFMMERMASSEYRKNTE